jgi:chromate transporter
MSTACWERSHTSEPCFWMPVASAGIFAPVFLFVLVSGFVIPRIRKPRVAGSIMDAVVVGLLPLVGVVAGQHGRSAVIDVPTLLTSIVSAGLMLRSRINSAWLTAAAGASGWL